MKKLSLILFLFSISLNVLIAQKVITKKHWGSDITKEEYQVDAQGQRNGFYKSYNPDGILLFSYNYKGGKEHGICIDYAGQRDGRDIYCYGKPLSERVMDEGKVKSEKYYSCANNTNYLVYTKKLIAPGIYEKVLYHKNGKISEKFNESSSYGKEKGMYEKYHENGKLAEKGMIDNGNIGNWFGFYENGDSMYVAKYDVGFETYYKKFYENKRIEYVKTMDDKFENITKTEYYQNGQVKSEIISKTFPFKYDCGSSNGKNDPKNWKELAEKRIRCGGDSYSPFDNSYVVSEKTYKENGELVSETINTIRNVDGKNRVYNKADLEEEDKLWENIQKDKSYESLSNYYVNAKVKLYYIDVNKIYTELNNKYQQEINSVNYECEKLESEVKYKVESTKSYMEIASTKTKDKLYPKFDAVNKNLDEQINTNKKLLTDLKSEISKMQAEIAKGDDKLLSNFNNKELSILIGQKLEPTKKMCSALMLKNKLWEKFAYSLQDKNLKKNLSKLTRTEELLEFIKQ